MGSIKLEGKELVRAPRAIPDKSRSGLRNAGKLNSSDTWERLIQSLALLQGLRRDSHRTVFFRRVERGKRAGVLWPLRYPSPGYRVRISETFRSAHPKTSARNEFNLLHILDFRRGSGRSDDQFVGVIAAASEGYFAFASIFSIRVQPSDQTICCVP